MKLSELKKQLENCSNENERKALEKEIALKEYQREYQKNYKKAHNDELKLYQKSYRELHKDEMKDYIKEYEYSGKMDVMGIKDNIKGGLLKKKSLAEKVKSFIVNNVMKFTF